MGAFAPQPVQSQQGGNFGRKKADLSTSEGLLALAAMQGGAIGQAAADMAHPEVGILSTIGNGFKTAFSDFVNLISVPSQTVAGILSQDLTVREAIKQNITPSDVLFGDKDPNASVYQKIGSFAVRTATDILLDPLTYVTFGAGQGLFGLRATSKVTLQENAARYLGKVAKDTASLSKEGQEVYKYATKLARQLSGGTSFEVLKTGDKTLDLVGDELVKVLGKTIDSPLKPDFAKKALANMLELKPQLTETLLDKGGIKFLGNTILSGQRISSAINMIPGMTKLDELTKQSRLAVSALFNNGITKTADGQYYRIPEEVLDLQHKWDGFRLASNESRIAQLDDMVRKFDMSETEAKFLTASMEAKRIPADPRLAKMFQSALGYNDAEWESLVKAGILSKTTRIEGHVPHIMVGKKVGNISFSMPPSTKTGAENLRNMARFIDEKSGAEVVGHASALGLKPVKDVADQFVNDAGDIYKRIAQPIHNIGEEEFSILEDTLLKSPENAAKMLQDMKQAGFEIFDDNAITAMAARTLHNNKAISMRYFLRDLAENYGYLKDVAPKEYARISSKAVDKAAEQVITMMGKEGELVFHPAIAAYIEKFMGSVINDDATMGFLKAFDSVQNFWKATVTSIFPAFHGRNAISNVLNNYLDIGVAALDPRLHAISGQMIKLDHDYTKLARVAGNESKMAEMMERVVFRDSTDYAWTFGELRQVLKNNGIAFTKMSNVNAADAVLGSQGLVEPLFGAKNLKEIVTGKGNLKAGQRVWEAAKTPFKFGQDVIGAGIENQGKMVNFLANLRKTGDVTLASQRTKQFLFDYGNLTNFERTFLKRLIPFYTFTRKNLELQARAILGTPGRVSAELQAIGSIGELLSGGEKLTDEERNALPEWIKNSTAILTKKNGNQITMIGNLGTPLEGAFQSLQPNQFFGSLSPALRLPAEQGMGYSFFQGKPLSEVTNATAFKGKYVPRAIKEFIGYTEYEATRSDGTKYTRSVSLRPERMNLILNLPPTSRVLTSLKQMQAVDVDAQYKILQGLTGIKPYAFDLERERQKKDRELRMKLEKLLNDAGEVAKFTRVFIPKENSGAFEK